VVAQRDTYGGLVRHLLNPAPRWIAALFVLAYILSLAFRVMGFYSRSMSDPLWGVSRGLQLMFSQPSTVAVAKAVAFAALLFLASAYAAVQLLKLFAGLGLFTALLSGIVYGAVRFLGRGFGFESALSVLPSTGNLIVDFLVSALLPIANLLSLLFDHAARTVYATMPAVPAMMLASSALGFLAMRIDKIQAAMGGWRLSERSILWYSVTGGGAGVISAALIYRHKTLHKALLIQAALATVLVYSVAIAGFSTI
jgi:uncharacterized membrane protein YsdA (DUF1294 family)